MRRLVRITGSLLVVAGVLTLAWALVVWQWQDPFTALYTHWQQEKLSSSLDHQFAEYHPIRVDSTDFVAEQHAISADARAYRAHAKEGQAIGRIVIKRISLNMVVVNGTDEGSLEKGPGRDLQTYMPGQNRLVYIAGHRTTYLAPFSHIDSIKPGDLVRLEMPYGTFVYRAYTHRVVVATDLSVLRSPKHEVLELQACHPRFFATHRYIVYAHLVRVLPRGGAPYEVAAATAPAR
jgi:sortase A